MPLTRLDRRIWVLIVLALLSVAAALALDPVAQDPAYHRFADRRQWLDIPNFGDVASNLAFLVVGLLGLKTLSGPRGAALFPDAGGKFPYLVFFAALVAVSAGSSYYHLAPTNARLLWDRLPIAVAFTGLFAAVLADRVPEARARVKALTAGLAVLGAAAVLHWYWSEIQGQGDLRFYALAQAFPVLALPVICRLYPEHRVTHGWDLGLIVGWYAASKVLEFRDAEVFLLTGEAVSGHTLKHLCAAWATYKVWRMMTGAEIPDAGPTGPPPDRGR